MLAVGALLALGGVWGCSKEHADGAPNDATRRTTAQLSADGVPMESFQLLCLSSWWIHGSQGCAPGADGGWPSGCEGTLLVRTFSPDRTRVDIPVDVTSDGHYQPRFDEARSEPFRFEFPDGPGLIVVTGEERHRVGCRYMGGAPTIDGAQAEAAPRELQDALFAWRKTRLAGRGLDPGGQPLHKP